MTLLEYPVWAWHWSSPDDFALPAASARRLELSADARRAKAAAVAAHRSQVEPLSPAAGDEALVAPSFREHFTGGFETFVVTEGARPSLGPDHFERIYAEADDPWGFEHRWYERRKRAVTLASLPRERFASAFEPGCSIGVLTEALAERCDRLLATDVAARPLEVARRRLAGRPGVRIERLQVPQEWPSEHFDLVVLSEIGYYLSAADLETLVRRAAASLTPDGVLVACHWRHPAGDPLRGDDVHALLREVSGLDVLVEHVEEDFRLDVLVRAPAVSVARREGLVP